MKECPQCPDLVALTQYKNSNLLLNKAKADIQHNYDSMWRSIQCSQNNPKIVRDIQQRSSSSSSAYQSRISSPIPEKIPCVMKSVSSNVCFTDFHSPDVKTEIKNEIIDLQLYPRVKKRLSANTKIFLSSIVVLCPLKYLMLLQVFKLPSLRTIERHISRLVLSSKHMHTNVSKIADLITKYRENNNISCTNIKAVLSIDALFFDKQIKISEHGNV